MLHRLEGNMRHASASLVFDLVEQGHDLAAPDVRDLMGTQLRKDQPLKNLAALLHAPQLLPLALEIFFCDRPKRVPLCLGRLALVPEGVATLGNSSDDGLCFPPGRRQAQAVFQGHTPGVATAAVLHAIAAMAGFCDHQAEARQSGVPINRAIARQGRLSLFCDKGRR
jgi:hypothetical protein